MRPMSDINLQGLPGRAPRDDHHYEALSALNNELAAAQRELAKKNAELSRLNEQKNQFLGMAAHDLRNPLEVILTYSQFLLEEAAPALDRDQVLFVDTIRGSSEFMLRLVEDLLDLARIEAGELALDLAAVDLCALAERNVRLNRALAAKKGTTIDFVRAAGCPPALPMRLDAPKVEQVLNNLLGNAVKFSPPGSAVEVRLAVERPAEARGRLLLTVADQGPGVPVDELERLFRPFVSHRARGTAGEKCTGLGLAIVQRIVEGHGGTIGVENRDGGGAIFCVSLPLDAPEPARGGGTGTWPRS